ncbi:MAG: hypothetical protein FJ104_02825 [Deltaproteobacteria bacterium]|nr:hypothetical protein [Deltaproteobacteria bacterium]
MTTTPVTSVGVSALVLALGLTSVTAHADTAPPPEEATPPAAAPAPPPAPYSLPFQMRPAAAVTVLRLDSTYALYDVPSPTAADPERTEGASTLVSTLLFSYKVTDYLAPFVRAGVVSNSPPVGDSFTGLTNVALGAMYGGKFGTDFRYSATLGVALPTGSGGGNSPEPEAGAARGAGIAARAGMDNALFAANDLVIFPGFDLAYVAGGLTVQGEVTLLQLTQVKGDERAQPDDSRTNLTTGLHVGYFVIPELSLAAELRHQRWLSTPTQVEKLGEELRDTTTVAIGPRAHIPLGEKRFLRPAITFAMPLDKPLTDTDHKLIQLDIPFLF